MSFSLVLGGLCEQRLEEKWRSRSLRDKKRKGVVLITRETGEKASDQRSRRQDRQNCENAVNG